MTTYTIGVTVLGHSGFRHDEDGRHECWIETFHVQAQAPNGQRWLLDDGRDYGNMGAAKAVKRHTSHDPSTQPDRWAEIEPMYGSEAWGPEHEYALACFEADCFHEPRPHW